MMANSKQQLIVSVWLPLGINNLSSLAEKLETYLNSHQDVLRFTNPHSPIDIHDLFIQTDLRCNSSYDYEEHNPDSLALKIRYYGWGLFQFSLSLDGQETEAPTFLPNFVNKNMSFLIERVVNVLTGTLLPHQYNYCANILFGNGVITPKLWFKAVLEGKLDQATNGLDDEAKIDEIRAGFRFDPKMKRDDSVNISNKRSHDLLVKTILLTRSITLKAPAAYDDLDGDFESFQAILQNQFVRGKHRSSLIMGDSKNVIQDELLNVIIGCNSVIRFSRYLIKIMVSVRDSLTIVRAALLAGEHIKVGVVFPDELKSAKEKFSKESFTKYLQLYLHYLLARIPLLNELIKYMDEAVLKVDAWFDDVDILIKEGKNSFEEDFIEELRQSREYMHDLLLTASRIEQGLDHEIASVSRLIDIGDQEEILDVSKQTKFEMEGLRDIKKFSSQQTTLLKRSLESQFIQGELVRSGEVRARVSRVMTQVAGAFTLASLLTNIFKGFIIAIATFLFGLKIDNGSNIDILLNAILPFVLAIGGWFIVGNILAQTRKFGGVVELIIPLKSEEFDEKVIIEKRLADPNQPETEVDIRHMRIEENTQRVTWEDQFTLKVRRGWLAGIFRGKNRDDIRGVLFTLEYTKKDGKSTLSSLSLSTEKSQVDDKSMKPIIDALISRSSKRMSEISLSLSEGGWRKWIEEVLASITENQVNIIP
jgi:hypothetical protein